MLKKIIGGLLILTIAGCVAGVVAKDAFVYVLSFMMLVAAILFGLLALVVDLIWKLLPGDFKKTCKVKKGRFNAIIFLSVLFFYIAGGLLDELYLRDTSKFIRLLGIIAIFVFAVFIVLSLIRRGRGKAIAVGSVVFTLFFISLLFISSLKSGKIADNNSIAKLGSLPYLNWVPAEQDIEKRGVVQYDPELAFDGLSFYNSWTLPEAYLIDMHGNIVHKWNKKLDVAHSLKDHAELCKNGDVIVIAVDQLLFRLDWNSKIKWKTKIRAHHDLFIDENKEICYVLAREDAMVFWQGIPVPILSDYIAVLSPNGKVEKKVYLYDLVKQRVPLHRIVKLYKGIFRFKEIVKFFVHKIEANYVCQHSWHFDIMHTNSIEIMDRSIEGFCKKGDWLISIRDLDLVAVLDPNKQEFVWTWGPGEVDMQHDAKLLENGNVLIFDNGTERGFSRVIELDPINKKIVWEYKSDPAEKFYSRFSGSSQRLPNGNTLITESDRGHVFEVTKEGRVVWDFYNPQVRVKDKKRGKIYRMVRITNPETPLPLARGKKGD
jgi:hypothetical protein